MTALTALLSASCSSDPYLSLISDDGSVGEEVEVAFSISTESAVAATRGPELHEPGQWQTVSKASNIDMLIYAVYDADYTLLKQYGTTDIPSSLSESAALTMKDENNAPYQHDGQTIRDVSKTLKSGQGVEEISLRLMRGKTYHIAFWAQSSSTKAFNTSDLENLQVIYDNAKNNDELRDAFCKVETFSVPAYSSKVSVVLTRPFAQINVGTTGADYDTKAFNGLSKNSSWLKKHPVAYSKITLSGVAQYMNVVKDEIDGDNLLKDVTFEWAYIPAFMNMPNKPTFDDSTKEKEKESKDSFIGKEGNYVVEADKETYTYTTTDAEGQETPVTVVEDVDDLTDEYKQSRKEEFLFVDLNNNGKLKGYKTTYPTRAKSTKDGTNDGEILTETFKYLSMCYVLVPTAATTLPDYMEDDQDPKDSALSGDGDNADATDDPSENDSETGSTAGTIAGSVLASIQVTFGEDNTVAGGVKKSFPSLKLTNVPVHRNWRTNILGGLYDGDPHDKNDPNFPDDPTSVFKKACCYVYLDPQYNGEYNNMDQEGWKSDGWWNYDDTDSEGDEEEATE